MLLHEYGIYLLVEINFSGIEFLSACVVPTVCSLWIDAELLWSILSDRRTDLWDLEHLIGVSDTDKFTERFDRFFGISEEFPQSR